MSMFDFMEQEPQSKEQSTAAAVEVPQKAKIVARYQSKVMMQEGYIEDIAILQYSAGMFYNQGRLTVRMLQRRSLVKREKMQKQ